MSYSPQLHTSAIQPNTSHALDSNKQSRPAGETPIYHYCKRALDVLLIGLSTLFLLPLFLTIALLIKIDSPGPIFYRQQRVGAKRTIRNGIVTWERVNFSIFKFRSMFTDTDDAIHQEHVRAWINGELDDDESGAAAKVKNDPRITRMGHFIRKTSLDELPQLINVALGEMSLVGPRPVPEYEVAQYRQEDFVRLEALPGLTGLWQVMGRGNVSFEEMMELDTEYIQTRSFWNDISIILRTIPAVLSGSGAE